MASVVPTHYLFSPSDDAARIAVAAVIDKSDEIGDLVERTNFLYATAGRRALLERAFVPAVTTTSATDLSLPDYYARLATTRDEASVETHAANAIITVGIYTTAGALIGSAVTLTHAAGSGSDQTATYTGITSSEVLVRVSIRRNPSPGSGSATLSAIRVLEDELLAGDLP